jgi:cytochrome bd-type quinol oxidase subunit 2
MQDISMEAMEAELPTWSSRRNSATSLVSQTSINRRKTVGAIVSRALESVSAFFNRNTTALNARIRASRYHGWRMGVLAGCVMSAFVLSCNVAILIAGSQIHGGYKQGIADLVSGSAPNISRWSTAAHLLINVFSTILLGASNYTMQVLSSPTRNDIDKAHTKRKWLDVGVLSIRNLRTIPRTRAMIWGVLAFSSVPLHLL